MSWNPAGLSRGNPETNFVIVRAPLGKDDHGAQCHRDRLAVQPPSTESWHPFSVFLLLILLSKEADGGNVFTCSRLISSASAPGSRWTPAASRLHGYRTSFLSLHPLPSPATFFFVLLAFLFSKLLGAHIPAGQVY